MTKILFVCKYNMFRSRIAEAYAKKYNGIQVSSGGIFAPGGWLSPTQERVIKQLNLKLSEPENINIPKLLETDIVIIVADDVPSELFEDDRHGETQVIKWNIPDILENDTEENIRATIEEIKERVFQFCEEL